MRIFPLFVVIVCAVRDLYGCETMSDSIRIFLNVLNKPLKITVMACWNKYDSINFLTSLSSRTSEKNAPYKQFPIRFVRNPFEDLPESDAEHHEIFLLDVNCNNAPLFLNASEHKMATHFTWLAFDSDLYQKRTLIEDNVLELFKHLPILPRSEIFFISCEHESISYEIKEVYRTALDQPLLLVNVGKILNGTFNDDRTSSITSRRRQNLHGIKLNASMVVTNNDTLKHLTDYQHRHIDPITKVNFKLTNYLMTYLNATVDYSIVYSWGYRNDETGVWSGMVGQLLRNEAELGASPLFMTTDRVPLIQYIAMPSPTGSRFVFRAPKLSYTDNVFLLPFNTMVWYSLIGLVVVTTICFSFSIYTEWNFYSDHEAIEKDNSILRPSVGDVCLVVFGATCQQGSSVAPRSITSRIIMVVAFTILMFLYTSYAANIVAMLQSPSTKIRTLTDLYHSRLQIGVDDTVFNRYYFAHAEDPIRRAIYENKVLMKGGKTNFMQLEQGVARIREGLFAFHMEVGIGYKVMSETFYEHEKCGLIEIAFLQVTDPWYAIRKNSSYKELFQIGMMRMREHGLQERENARLYTRKPKCSGSGGNFISASLVDTKPAMLVLLWGMLFTIFVFIIEKCIVRMKVIQEKRKQKILAHLQENIDAERDEIKYKIRAFNVIQT